MTAPRVRVNQVGYLTDGPKAATLVTGATAPVPWRLRCGGVVVAEGDSQPRGHDPSAGLDVHVLTFDEVRQPGDGFVLEADGATSDPFAIGSDLYDDLRVDALVVFYGQRSGIAMDEALLGPGYGRAAGHVDVAPNRGDGAVPCLPAGHATTAAGVDLYDGWTGGYALEVTGGWYDAGDQGKYVVNGGIAVAQLLGLYERALRTGTADALGDGSLRVPERGNGVPDVLDEARWELTWMLRMRVPAGERYAGLVHHKVSDERWVPLPVLPADDPQPRYLHRPSTAATLNLAAVAAQGARLFAPHDEAFAAQLRTAARDAYDAAREHPVLLAPDTNVLANAGSGPYDDADLDDDFLWAATELYLTTGDDRYADDLRANPYAPVFRPEGFDWNHVAAWSRLQLATVPSALPERDTVRASVVEAADAIREQQATQPFGTRTCRRPAGTTGAPTASSSTTSRCWQPLTRSPATPRTATRSSPASTTCSAAMPSASPMSRGTARGTSATSTAAGTPTSSTRPSRTRRAARCPAARTPTALTPSRPRSWAARRSAASSTTSVPTASTR
ncbi:hypothetical protein ASG23_05260 [Cellulomonas sp. Leaf395]|nr:hypothetical protein ASG23_05260 [Cellulomonas sp. Leaf395]